MASIKDIKIDVSVETIIHNELREAIQYISERHGITINTIDVSWLDISEQGRKAYLVDKITMSTTK